MFDLNKFIKEKTLSEKLIWLIGLVLVFLAGRLTKNFPFLDIASSILEKISPLWLLGLNLFLFLLLIAIILYYSSKTSSKKYQSEFITRYNLNWKKIGNKIDPHPYCLCCDTPHPLKEHSTHSENQKCVYFRCIHSREKSGHLIDGMPHWAKKDDKPFDHREAYKLVCEELNIKPTLTK